MGDAGARAQTRVVSIVGPTGVGKTAVAERVAAQLGGEVVDADSMQVYRGMDVGTAKPAAGERLVPHHLLDVADPGEPFSAALYQRLAREAIDGIAARGLVPVLCGGTGLYVRAVLDDWDFAPGDLTSEARDRYASLALELGPDDLHALLAERDPRAAALVHPHNVRRVVRALEVADAGGSYADRAERFAERHGVYDATIIGLDADRAELYRRIDARVDAMLAAGLLDEVRALLAAGYRDALTAAQAIGYKELVPVLDGYAPLEDAVAAIKQASRRYAKRQRSWFRADPRVRWVDVTGLDPAEAAAAVLTLVES